MKRNIILSTYKDGTQYWTIATPAETEKEVSRAWDCYNFAKQYIKDQGISTDMLNDLISVEVFEAGRVPFEKLPDKTQLEVIETLDCWTECHVSLEHGIVNVHVGISIKNEYDEKEATLGFYTHHEYISKHGLAQLV